MNNIHEYDFTDFWDSELKETKTYTCGELEEHSIVETEQAIGHIIPTSYKEVLKFQNGGIPKYRFYAIDNEEFSYLEVTMLYGIGNQERSLGGTYGHSYAVEHLGYPDKGIYFADTNQEGMLMLGLEKEPVVYFVSQQNDFTIRKLEDSLIQFIFALETDSETTDEQMEPVILNDHMML